MIKVFVSHRVLAVFLGAGLGGVASMTALRLFHNWAFTTEFRLWLSMTVIHACMVFVLFSLWFGVTRTNLRRLGGVANCIAAFLMGGLVAVFIPWGFVLVVSGQAFITSGVATLAYIAVSVLDHGKRLSK